MRKSFLEFAAELSESNPVTRSKQAAALGTGPAIPSASVNSSSSGTPFQVFKVLKDEKDSKQAEKDKKKASKGKSTAKKKKKD